MFEHGELVRELPIVQQMPVERRLQHAQQRRKQQLEFWRSQNREVFSGSEHIKLNNINAKLKFSDEVLLLDATQRSDVDEVKELLKRNVRPDIKNHDGFTALHQSSIDGNVEILKLLIKYGANVNCVDDDGWTPLHAAVACRRLPVIRTLIENGADLLVINNEMTFPYDMSDDIEILTFLNSELHKRGITIDMMEELRHIPEEQYFDFLKKGGIDDSSIILQRIDSSNATHLHFAAAYNFCQVARYLLSLGILVDVLDNKHWTSLHVACHFSQQAMIQVLLENQADPTILTDKGHTAYELCSNHEMQEWMANFVTMLSQSDPLKRRATLPPSYTNVSNDFSFKRNSLRRSSLREHRNFKRHNDNYRFVLIAKDTLCNSMTDNNFEQKAKIDESLNHENSNNQNSKLDETANKIDIELDYNIKDDNIMDKAGFAANYNQSLIDNHSSIEMMSSQSEYKRTISNEKRNGKWFGCCSIF